VVSFQFGVFQKEKRSSPVKVDEKRRVDYRSKRVIHQFDWIQDSFVVFLEDRARDWQLFNSLSLLLYD